MAVNWWSSQERPASTDSDQDTKCCYLSAKFGGVVSEQGRQGSSLYKKMTSLSYEAAFENVRLSQSGENYENLF